MRKTLLLFISIFSLFVSAFSQQDENNHVTAARLRQWVEFLSSDKMKGRQNGSPEMKTAAEWIQKRFQETGLLPFCSIGSFFQEYEYNKIKERNVIGYIQGTDPSLKNEFIVISAHFDHIGISEMSYPDSVFNGADDNAAGTVTMLAIAETIMKSENRPGRSILFAAFSGEEHGMQGSRYFVTHSPIKTNSFYVNLNFEMTGRSEYLGPGKYYMTGCKNSNLDEVIIELSKNPGFTLVDSIPVTDFLFNSSDNISFSTISAGNNTYMGIPSGTFATSAISDYLHTVTDESAYLDYENMAELVEHFSNVIISLSNSKKSIDWTNDQYRRSFD